MEILEKNPFIYEKSYSNELFPLKKQEEWREVFSKIHQISEIRMRVNQPVLIYLNGREHYLSSEGKITGTEMNSKVIREDEIRDFIAYWCGNSRYAYEEQLKQGFLTLKNGHRVGICGEIVLDEKQKITTLKYISSLNIRLAHQVKGCSLPILPYLYEGDRVKNILILSAPAAGKTTLLRDLVRIISEGNYLEKGKSVSLIDERKEIAACYQGVPQLEVGKRTDIMDGCPKQYGMQMVLRSMSPEVIAVDELGGKQEWEFLQEIARCGTGILATVHADSYEEWRKKHRERKGNKEEIFDLVVELFKEKNNFRGRIYERGRKEPCCIY